MASAGNSNIQDIVSESAERQLDTLLSQYTEILRDGLTSLMLVHHVTNQIVKHGDSTLDECLLSDDVLRTYVLALMVEVGEFVQTLQWKPWRKTHVVEDRSATLSEFADILAFIGVLLTILNARGFSVDEIVKEYTAKEHINFKRFMDEWKPRS